jgi:D-alanyl-D-alanine carboxypeptidase/D-alanyl-D-alanine-endopeptidase (penicillin-binding protein 4)
VGGGFRDGVWAAVRRRLIGAVAVLVAVGALLLALDGSLSHTSGQDGTVAAATRSTAGHTSRRGHRRRTHTVTVPGSPTLTPVARLSSGPAQQRLRRALDRSLASAHTREVGALVYDITAGRELYAAHPATGRPPASVEKLWTATALMDRLGPDARLHTAILGTGFQRGGVWHGNLYLRGGGDPTFGDTAFNEVWNHGYGANAATLVAQLQRRGIHRVTGRLYADESLFDTRRGALITDYRPDIPDLGGQLSALTYDHGTTLPHYTPATFAAHEVALTMRGFRIAVTAAGHSARTPVDADLLATVASPPTSELIRLMNVPSDDFFAELLTKQLGVLFGHGGSISAGAAVIAQTIAAHYGLRPLLLDGSGLGRADRTSPLQVVELLRDVNATAVGRELSASLPTTGVNGTVQGIGAKTAAQGRCLAKTGSLNNVTNLAGYCETRSGQEIAFGLFIDGPDNGTGFELESRMVGAIAAY